MKFDHVHNIKGFFSDYFLGSVLGQDGRRKTLVDHETQSHLFRFLKLYERAEPRATDLTATREQFIRPLLRDILGFHMGTGEDRLFPLLFNPEDDAHHSPLLLYAGEWDENLDDGRDSPARKFSAILASRRIPYGILATGQVLRLVRAQGEGPRGAYLEIALGELAETENSETFALLFRLFHSRQFKKSEDGKTSFQRLEEQSLQYAQKVSEELKGSVFSAAETLVTALLTDATQRGDLPATAISEPDLRRYRDAAFTTLYRLLFILYAEARDPRLQHHTLYRDSYSIEALLAEVLLKDATALPANRYGYWDRLKALFWIFDKGLPKTDRWENIPPRGSRFFSSETPEGQVIRAARLSDRAVAQVLLKLATTTPRSGVGRERISFRELDIENLGHVYEGLLEYEPRLTTDTLLEVDLQGKTYVVSPEDAKRIIDQKGLSLSASPEDVQGTCLETLVKPAEENEGEDEDADDESEEEETLKRGAPLKVVRRLAAGEFHFIPGIARKGSGSYYTPLPLVRDLVRHALGPLVEDKSASEIESLRVLDPACGSAHFLVEAMRFMGQALHRAYVKDLGGKRPPAFTHGDWEDNWKASDEEARAANSEARAWCKRRVAERCLFGVDLNPAAVDLARVALWVESLAGDRPLTYFEHHIRCGNSLLGTWRQRLQFPPIPGLPHYQRGEGTLFANPTLLKIQKAAELRRMIDWDGERRGFERDSVQELDFKEHRFQEAQSVINAARLVFDMRVASAFLPEIWGNFYGLMTEVDDEKGLVSKASKEPWWGRFQKVRDRERFFHWELEFPEVFLDPARPGFDAILGNPPWEKIKPDRKEFFARADVLIRAFVGGELDRRIKELIAAHPGLQAEFENYEKRLAEIVTVLKKGGDFAFQDWAIEGKSTGGDPDLFKYFLELAHKLTRPNGQVGVLVPSAIYNNEGCTGLRHMLLDQSLVERFYGFENRKKVFPIHSSYKFVNLVFRKVSPSEMPADPAFQAAFMRHDPSELADPAPKPWTVIIKKSELTRLSPGTLAFLEYRSPRDREILLKMYEGKPLLGDSGPGTWNARFYREFDMTNDRDLWTDDKGKLFNPRSILGPVPGTTAQPPYYTPAAWPDIRQKMADKGFWPLYEGKHIDQFIVDTKPIERWVSLEACTKKYKEPPDPKPKLVFRDIASNTNERTCIAAVLPEKSCFGHTLSGLRGDNLPDSMSAILNSLVFDFGVRFRTAGTHLSFSYIDKMPIPGLTTPPFPSKCVDTLSIDNITQLDSLWPAYWTSNRAVAEAYGLGPDDFGHILTTFPVFARKRPAFFAYLQQRLAEWKAGAPLEHTPHATIK